MRGKYEAPPKSRKKWLWIAGACALVVIIAIVVILLLPDDILMIQPTLTVETPQKIGATNGEGFVLDVTISSLGEAIYPAASMSIEFDSSCLEFLGIEEGNVFITGEKNGAGEARKMPEWSCNVENSKASGCINIMYLDMTGGKHAFRQELLAEEDNVILRLRFRLRGSVRAGDVFELNVKDAVFAASDETQSLAMTTDTLKVKNGKIVTGE